MNQLVKIYRFFVYAVFTFFVVACGAESMDQEVAGESAEDNEQMVEATKTEESPSMASAEESEMYLSNKEFHKWKKKAKQQLESIQDLIVILKDPSLDSDFKIEIEKELIKVYETIDSSGYDLLANELNFKKFKDLEVEGTDTLTMMFKNDKEQLKAEFIVVEETKMFGETSEVVAQLKLLSIEAEK